MSAAPGIASRIAMANCRSPRRKHWRLERTGRRVERSACGTFPMPSRADTVDCPPPPSPEIQRVPLGILDHEPYAVAPQRLGGRCQVVGFQLQVEVLAKHGRVEADGPCQVRCPQLRNDTCDLHQPSRAMSTGGDLLHPGGSPAMTKVSRKAAPLRHVDDRRKSMAVASRYAAPCRDAGLRQLHPAAAWSPPPERQHRRCRWWPSPARRSNP